MNDNVLLQLSYILQTLGKCIYVSFGLQEAIRGNRVSCYDSTAPFGLQWRQLTPWQWLLPQDVHETHACICICFMQPECTSLSWAVSTYIAVVFLNPSRQLPPPTCRMEIFYQLTSSIPNYTFSLLNHPHLIRMAWIPTLAKHTNVIIVNSESNYTENRPYGIYCMFSLIVLYLSRDRIDIKW